MQLHQLRYVVAVADTEHFTHAANQLMVAQPSVSNAIRALERELGATLFHRGRGGASPTAAGQTFVPWARRALADCEAGRAAVADLLELRQGRIALGATPSLVTNILPAALADFHDRYPGIELSLYQAGSEDLVSSLAEGRLDVALVILPVVDALVEPTRLFDEDLVLAVSPTHPLAGREAITIAELEGVPLVMFRPGYDLRTSTFEACRLAGFRPTLAIDGGEMDGVLALTEAGLGAAVLPETMVRPDGALRAVPFLDGGMRRTVGVARRRDRPLPPAAEVFVQQLSRRLAA